MNPVLVGKLCSSAPHWVELRLCKYVFTQLFNRMIYQALAEQHHMFEFMHCMCIDGIVYKAQQQQQRKQCE
jgi:hypothetical protein